MGAVSIFKFDSGFSCDLCEKSFGEKAQLLRHRKVHFRPALQEPDISEITEDQVVIEKEKRCMRCGICKKLLNSKVSCLIKIFYVFHFTTLFV